jgi:hypothetical protein
MRGTKLQNECLTLAYNLWEWTWRDDAVVKGEKQYAVPGRVRRIDHKG